MQASVPSKVHPGSPQGVPACFACAFYKLNLCAAVRQKSRSATDFLPGVSPLTSSTHTIPPRRAIHHPKEWSEFVPVVCNGWALSSIALPDGRRQILSILLAGDIAFSAGLFEPASGYAAEAITEVTYRKFKRVELKDLLFEHRDLFEMLTKIWNEERARADQLALGLGRRTATERIARLILNLTERLAERGMMMNGQTMGFPFRQRHIADATGLTAVHVSKVLGQFQRDGLIEISNRSLTITDATELRQVAGP
jgi:CRP-like cAMP-binding protein